MKAQYIYSRNGKTMVGVAIVGFVLAALFCKLDGAAAQRCNLLDKTAWAALEVLRSVIMLADWQAGIMPSQKLLAEMGKFNEALVKAGVLLAAEGLQASSKGKRVRFSGAKRTVIDGPFTETKELIAGFWLW